MNFKLCKLHNGFQELTKKKQGFPCVIMPQKQFIFLLGRLDNIQLSFENVDRLQVRFNKGYQ